MRDAKRTRYFHQAVLFALAVPSCGGSALVVEGSGDGGNVEGGSGGSRSGVASSGVGSSSSGSLSSSSSSSGGASSSSGSSSSGSGGIGGSSGGSSGSSTSSEGGSDAAFNIHFPQTPCSWGAVYNQNTCGWSYGFDGDPVQCVGFTGSGTAEQCLAICGTNAFAPGLSPTSCSESPPSFIGDQSRLNCRVTGPPGC